MLYVRKMNTGPISPSGRNNTQATKLGGPFQLAWTGDSASQNCTYADCPWCYRISYAAVIHHSNSNCPGLREHWWYIVALMVQSFACPILISSFHPNWNHSFKSREYQSMQPVALYRGVQTIRIQMRTHELLEDHVLILELYSLTRSAWREVYKWREKRLVQIILFWSRDKISLMSNGWWFQCQRFFIRVSHLIRLFAKWIAENLL